MPFPWTAITPPKEVQALSVTDHETVLLKNTRNTSLQGTIFSLEARLAGREEAGPGPWRRGRYRVLGRRNFSFQKKGKSEV